MYVDIKIPFFRVSITIRPCPRTFVTTSSLISFRTKPSNKFPVLFGLKLKYNIVVDWMKIEMYKKKQRVCSPWLRKEGPKLSWIKIKIEEQTLPSSLSFRLKILS